MEQVDESRGRTIAISPVFGAVELQSLFDDQSTSDIAIKFEFQSYIKAHKAILIRCSKWFDRMLGHGAGPEWEREEIELDDADGKNVDVMLRYMYNINWLENKQEEQDDKTWSQLDKLADVYLIARKYEVDGLMAMAVEQMKKILKGDTGELAEPKYLSEYDPDEYQLTEVLRLVWLNTSTEDKDVRSKLAYFGGRHFEELIKEGPFVETVLDIPDLKIWVCLARVLEVDRKDAQNDGGQGEVDAGNE